MLVNLGTGQQMDTTARKKLDPTQTGKWSLLEKAIQLPLKLMERSIPGDKTTQVNLATGQQRGTTARKKLDPTQTGKWFRQDVSTQWPLKPTAHFGRGEQITPAS